MQLEPTGGPQLYTAHVLFIDIVGYSRRPMEEQPRLLEELQELVRSIPDFQRAEGSGDLLRLPTGDGMALVFFLDPVTPVECAMQLARTVASRPHLALRMGLHSGPVYRVPDINANTNVSGGGINIAQRVMSCGDAGHILLSSAIVGLLGQIGAWPLHDLGECEVKHGESVHLYNLDTDDIGNADLPEVVRARLRAAAVALDQSRRELRGVTRDLEQLAPGGDRPAAPLVELSARLASPAQADERVALVYWRGAQPDEQLLQLLEGQLRAHGHRVFIDRHLSIGVEWANEIEREVRGSDAVIPLLSSASKTCAVRAAVVATTGAAVSQPIEHGHFIWYVAFSPDGRFVVTGSEDSTARVWDAATGKPVCPPLVHTNRVFHAAFSADGRRVMTAGWDGTCRLWDMAAGESLVASLPHGGAVWAATFSRDGRRILTAGGFPGRSGQARVWDVDPRAGAPTGRPLGSPLEHSEVVRCAAFSADGQRVLTGSGDRTARVWNAQTGAPITPPMEHSAAVIGVAFSPDGLRLVTASSNLTRHDNVIGLPGTLRLGEARVWDAATGKPVTPVLNHGGAVFYAEFSPDRRRVVTAGADSTARIWDAGTGKQVGPPLRHRIVVVHAAFSPDGRRVITACSDGTVEELYAQVWDVATGKPVGPPLRHRDGVRHAVFSPDGRRVVTCSEDSTARLWDAATGRSLTPPLKHQLHVTSAAFSADGRFLVTTSADSTARVWHASTGEPVTPPLRHGNRVLAASFSPDGRRVVSGGDDQTAKVWDLSLRAGSAGDSALISHFLVAHRLDPARGFVPLELAAQETAWQSLRGRHPDDFTTSPAEALAWHRRQVDECENNRQWPAAIVHLDRLIETDPAPGVLLERRANLNAALKRWDRAAADLARAIQLRPESGGYPRFRMAVAKLASGDREGYRAACARFLAEMERSRDPGAAIWLCMACILGPDAVADSGRLVRHAEAALVGQSRNPFLMTLLGGTLYRAGRDEEAIQKLEEASRLPLGGGDGFVWLLLSMPNQRLGRAEAAREWFAKGAAWIRDNLESSSDQAPAGEWDYRLVLEMLHAEADRLLRAGPSQ